MRTIGLEKCFSENKCILNPPDDSIVYGRRKRYKPLNPPLIVGKDQIKGGKSSGDSNKPSEEVPCNLYGFPAMSNQGNMNKERKIDDMAWADMVQD